MKLTLSFYLNSDVVKVARQLLGNMLFTRIGGVVTAGVIVEVEAYCGATDRASHAYHNKVTDRTQIMFENGGICYVYLCYGIHNLFNIVTNVKGKADAVLVRAIEPRIGIEDMIERRNHPNNSLTLTSGPGRLSQALGISRTHNGVGLTGNDIWIEMASEPLPLDDVAITTRIGVDYAGPDAILPWRFYIRGNKWVSKQPSRKIDPKNE